MSESPRPESPPFLAGGGRMGALMRGHDWAASPLGSPQGWPACLRSTVSLMLGSRFPMFSAFGPELGFLYNDAYAEILGAKHPAALGRPFPEVWPEIWPDLAPLVATALAGEPTWSEDRPLTMNRHGRDEQTWFTFSYSPVRDEAGRVAGMFCACTETTARVLAEERMREAEARLTAVTDHLPGGYVYQIATPRDGSSRRFLYVSRGFERMTGIRAEAVLADPTVAYDLILPEHRPRIAEAEAAAIRDLGAFDVEAPMRRRDGTLIRTRIISAPRLVDDGVVWDGLHIDDTARRQAEDQLRESEARLRLATEAAEVGLWDVDVVHDTLFWPARVKAMFGISPEVPVTMADYYAGLHPEDRAATSAAFAAALDPERRALYDVEYRTVGREDGVVRWVAAKGRGLFEGGRCVRVVGTALDITARKRTEAALRASEARLKTVFAQAAAGLALSDPSGRFTEVNDTYCALVGRTRDALLALRMQDITHPDDLARNAALFEAAARHGTPFDIEKRYLRPDGSTVWVRNSVSAVRSEEGRILAMLAVSVDTTSRVRAEAALRESEARQRALIEGVPQLVWRAAEDGRWTWASPQWTAYTGQPEPESRGLGWLAPIHPDDRARALEAWSEALRTGALDVEYRLHNAAEDRDCWFQTRAVPVRDARGAIREWLGTSTDIDNLRRLQEQQGVMVAELQHRTRNLLAVATSIAHETLARTGPGEAFVARFEDRLAALSRVQGLLSRSAEAPITLEALVRMELQALGVGEQPVALHGPAVPLRPSTVQTLALALHELATNARKHGALATAQGTLTVRWRTRSGDPVAGSRRWLLIDWIETDPHAARTRDGAAAHRGYGRELIEEALPFALGARTRYELDAGGVRCRIELPLDRRGLKETDA